VSSEAVIDQHSIAISDLNRDDEGDIEQAAALLVAAFPHWLPTMAMARAEVEEALSEDRICLAARSGETILGWVGAIPQYSHAWEVHPLVVKEDARGSGVGRALVAALEERLHSRGVLMLYLGSDDDGPTPGTSVGGIDLFPNVLSHAAALTVFDHPVAFYRTIGFEVVGLIPDANGPGKPDILMAKRIASGS
jgi:aminoglycoside 6'-N-acetyltransferase I